MVKGVKIGVLLLVFTLVLSACGVEQSVGNSNNEPSGDSSSTQPIVVKFSHEGTPQSIKGQAADKFKELLESKSNGQFIVEVYPSSQLYTDNDAIEQIQYNNIQMIDPSMTKLVSFHPAFQIVDMPFLFKDEDAWVRFVDGEAMKKLYQTLEQYNMKVMTTWLGGFKQFTANKPLRKPEDFAGLKFRTQSGMLLEEQFKALNTAAVPLPFAEVYVALQQGVVDGQENTLNNIDTQKYYEVQKYLTISNHGRLDWPVIVNKQFWESLTPEQQQVFKEALDEATEFERGLNEKMQQDSLQKFIDENLFEIYELSEEELKVFQETMQPVYDKFEAQIGKELMEAARAANQ